MSSNRDKRDMAKLIRTLKTMDRLEVAQFIAQAVDEMTAEEMPVEAIHETCAELCRCLGLSGEDLRRALN